ncbi:MAG: RNA-directed DNA polymerase (Reverse transcriptase) [Candidatus Moranbacteria bacterium GW2011_GWF2_44_10]|nr:MAG: RNA-directed DNA polymerase (Reverse transcriptase) [Candidatus Moranbacteria bacterium GW2011_GWF2_44_10]
MKIYKDVFEKIISPENLFSAWDNFKVGKIKKKDVQAFESKLEQNIFQLHRELRGRSYRHGSYASFYIRDPNQRHIHKAEVRDRILHHAVFSILNPIFEATFISHSFSCRIGKGTHKGVIALEKMIRKETQNYSRRCFILKCDVRKFFDTVDHGILMRILKKRIKDENALCLLREIISSFSSEHSDIFTVRGLPIGNLTSQLFANIFLNELDQFVKNKMRLKFYARYTDDFVIVGKDERELKNMLSEIRSFLKDRLSLELHPKKIVIRKYSQGIDYLGYIVLPHYQLLRTKTKKRVFKKLKMRIGQYRAGEISEKSLNQSLQSYLGVFSHADTHELEQELLNQFWFWLNE